MIPGRRYFPARSISRSAAGRNVSRPTAAILPPRMATPPSMVPAGVTIKPFLKTRSAVVLAISYSANTLPSLFPRFRQVTQVDNAIDGRRHFLQAELSPVLSDSPRSLDIHAAVPWNRFLGLHVKSVGFLGLFPLRLGPFCQHPHYGFFVFGLIEELAGSDISPEKTDYQGFIFLRPIPARSGDRVLKVVDVIRREPQGAEAGCKGDEIRWLINERASDAPFLHGREALRRAAETDHFIIGRRKSVARQHARQHIIERVRWARYG